MATANASSLHSAHVECSNGRAITYVEAGVVPREQEVAGVELVLVSRGRLADSEASHHHHLLEQHRKQVCQSTSRLAR